MKKTTIIIGDKPFTYNDEIEDITYDSISAITESEARFLLEETRLLFDMIGLPFYLAFGTLLGAVRDKTLIKGDEDVDIFIEDETLLRTNLPFLSERGFNVCRISDGVLYSFRISGSRSYIDVYIRKKLPVSIWSLWCSCLYNRAVPRRYLNKKTTIAFLGREYLIPAKPERLLEFWYGKNWRTPVRGHKFTYETPSRYWWKTKGQYEYEQLKHSIKAAIQKLIGWKYWRHMVKKD